MMDPCYTGEYSLTLLTTDFLSQIVHSMIPCQKKLEHVKFFNSNWWRTMPDRAGKYRALRDGAGRFRAKAQWKTLTCSLYGTWDILCLQDSNSLNSGFLKWPAPNTTRILLLIMEPLYVAHKISQSHPSFRCHDYDVFTVWPSSISDDLCSLP